MGLNYNDSIVPIIFLTWLTWCYLSIWIKFINVFIPVPEMPGLGTCISAYLNLWFTSAGNLNMYLYPKSNPRRSTVLIPKHSWTCTTIQTPVPKHKDSLQKLDSFKLCQYKPSKMLTKYCQTSMIFICMKNLSYKLFVLHLILLPWLIVPVPFL